MKASSRATASIAVLAAAVATGAFLRFDGLGVPAFWLDEILSLTLPDNAAAQPWWHWLTGLDAEHGPLFIAMQVLSRWAGSDEFAARLIPALLGCLTIVVIWLAARRASARFGAAEVSVILLATSPLHVYYSREARPYALILTLTTALLAAMLARSRTAVLLLLLAATLCTSAATAPVLLAVACTAALEAFLLRGERRALLAAASATLATLLIPLLYRGSAIGVKRSPAWPLDRTFAVNVLDGFTVSAIGPHEISRTMIAIAVLAAVGLIVLARRDPRAAIIAGGMTLLPFLFSVASLRVLGHWFAIRYVMPSLPGFLVLAGIGVVAVGEAAALVVASRRPRAREPVAALLAIAIALAVVTETWSNARREAFQKLDWRVIAAVLESHVKPGDVVAMAEPYSYLCLRHYMKVPDSVQFVLLDFVAVGDDRVRNSPAAWLVNAGYATPVSEWMCGFVPVLASPIDGFQLHYAPSRSHFLLHRATDADRRAVAAALGTRQVVLRFTPEDELFLGEGWAGREVTRWAVGRRATLFVPRGARADREIRVHAYPLTSAGLGDQVLRVSVNGHAVATVTLAPEWRDYAFAVPAASWIEGVNEIAFDFTRATAPSSIDPSSSDHRELAVNFEWIAISDAGVREAASAAPATITLRAGADRFLDEKTVWRGTSTRFPAATLKRDPVERLLGRLGFDPLTTWPRLARGEVHLDNVIETVATSGGCEDDAAFVRRAFLILLERPPSAEEGRDFLLHLSRDPSRIVLAGRIAKTNEFRRRMVASQE